MSVDFLTPMKSQMKNRLIPMALLAILILALGLRVHTVLNTEVNNPLRADAGEYFLYAYNLNHFGIFSRSADGFAQTGMPEPDAYRTPGYPLFLALFVDGKASEKMLAQILLAQALLSTLVVYLTFLICRNILSETKALAVALLTALSPHLININTYLLSEALFSFTVILFFWVLSRMKEPVSPKMFLLLGVFLGLASLVRPILQYFVILLVILSIFYYGFRKGRQLGAIFLVGYFLVFGSWMARNLYTLGELADDSVKYYTIKFGLYPGMMYQDDPKSYGYPYMFDPNASRVKPELGSVLQEAKRRFTTEPIRHLKWYGYEKGVLLWSWKMAIGTGEHLIFPVDKSPYFHNPLFTATSQVMKILHWPLVLLGLLGTIIIWIPRYIQDYNRDQIFFIRSLSILFIYYTAIHVLSFSIPRYTIPIRPLLYTMAFVPLAPLQVWIQRWRNPNPSPDNLSSP
jgi:4-amino-4-deoxy-L-arabinose transferase-like glycosyltransferase